MSHDNAANRHRDRTDHEGPGSDGQAGARADHGFGGEVKTKIYKAEAKERNVAEPIKAALETGISAKPLFAMEKEAEPESGKKAEDFLIAGMADSPKSKSNGRKKARKARK